MKESEKSHLLHLIWCCRYETEKKAWMDVSLLSFSMDEPTSVGLPRTSQDQSAHAGPSPVIPARASPPRPPRLSCVLSFCPRHIWSVQLSWMNVSFFFFFFYEWNSFLIADERVRSTGRDWQSSPPPLDPSPAHELPANHRQAGWLMLKRRRRACTVDVAYLWFTSDVCKLQPLWNIEYIIYNNTEWIKDIICTHTNVWNAKAVVLI